MDTEIVSNSLKRCSKILFDYKDFDSFIKNAEESINTSYTKEELYKDLLICSTFSLQAITDFIKHIIHSNNNEDISIILKNLELLDSYCLTEVLKEDDKLLDLIATDFVDIFKSFDEKTQSKLLIELSNNPKWKATLINGIKNGLAKECSIRINRALLNILITEKDAQDFILNRYQDFFSYGYDMGILEKMMQEGGLPEEELLQNKHTIFNNIYGDNIILFIKWLSERGQFNEQDISLSDYVKALHNDIKDEQSLKMLEFFYKELIERQHISLKDIDVIGKGENSKSYKIGEFVLKVGDTRVTKIIPYHKRILLPLIRQESNPESKDNSRNMYIEIQNAVDNKWYTDMSDYEIQEELYRIYRDMRKDGLIWTDIKKENVGRLIKPNKTNYYIDTLIGELSEENSLHVSRKELEVNTQSTGMTDIVKEECLQSGQLVILDTDYIFREEERNLKQEIKSKRKSDYIIFERRYMYELEQEKQEGR